MPERRFECPLGNLARFRPPWGGDLLLAHIRSAARGLDPSGQRSLVMR